MLTGNGLPEKCQKEYIMSTYNESGLKTVFPIYLVSYRFSTFGGILQKLPVYGRALTSVVLHTN
jgi:hypothetical protein